MGNLAQCDSVLLSRLHVTAAVSQHHEGDMHQQLHEVELFFLRWCKQHKLMSDGA